MSIKNDIETVSVFQQLSCIFHSNRGRLITAKHLCDFHYSLVSGKFFHPRKSLLAGDFFINEEMIFSPSGNLWQMRDGKKLAALRQIQHYFSDFKTGFTAYTGIDLVENNSWH